MIDVRDRRGGNHLLAALADCDYAPLADHLDLVPMKLGDVIYEPGTPLRHAIFPTTAIVSLHYVTASGDSAETAGVGREGVVGVSLFMGGDTMSSSAVVQVAGDAFRLAPELLQREFKRSGAFQRLLLRYTQALIAQVSQTAACNRFHAIEQQLSRWLLLAVDRAGTLDLVMTQELVASMLGVRRESITEAAGRLARSGAIQYRRGHIAVIDKALLEQHACECYGVVKQVLERIGEYEALIG
jgi:CRP-like cAMP-binding protein